MDISGDVLKLATEQTGNNFKEALKNNEPLRLNLVDGKIEAYYVVKVGFNGVDIIAKITWEQIFAIMHNVQKTGRIKKVVNTDVQYLENDYIY